MIKKLLTHHWVIAALAGMLVMAAAGTLFGVRFTWYSVSTPVMQKGLKVNEVAVVDTSAAGGVGVNRGDVVLISGRAWPGGISSMRYVWRVVGVGGDRVTCCAASGLLAVNGLELTEPYVLGDNAAFGPFDVTVPPGDVFLLGDSRSSAADSRQFISDPAHGMIPTSAITGRVTDVVYPPAHARSVDSDGAFANLGGRSTSAWTSYPIYLIVAFIIGVLLVLIGPATFLVRLLLRLRTRRARNREPILQR